LNPLTVMFRCDAGADHGLGHLSRCVAIADAAAARGAATRFYVHADDALRSFAGAHEWHAMPWDTGLAGDLEHMQRELEHTPDSVVVVDNKRVGGDYVPALRTLRAVAQIVDGDPRESAADIVINNHPGAEAFAGPGRLLGPAYNTVRPGYFDAARKPDRNAILVTLGGEDPGDHATWVLRHLGDLFAGRPVIVVVGPAHPDPASVEQAARAVPGAEIFRAPRNLVPFAERSDIAISAGGTTCYELAAAGIATATIATEPHQRDLIGPLAERGAVLPLGDANLSAEAARMIVGGLLTKPDMRRRVADAARALFPAPGAPRIAEALFTLAKAS
jgi:spore coat polysaccharide biosynthesis predicted glycosyltransferase SpsG